MELQSNCARDPREHWGANLSKEKEDEATMRDDLLTVVARRFKEAKEAEMRREDELIAHLNATYPTDEGTEARTDTVFGIARAVVALAEERGQLKQTREDTLRLAQAYLAARQKRQDAMASLSEHL
jgi:hypothetical protein